MLKRVQHKKYATATRLAARQVWANTTPPYGHPSKGKEKHTMKEAFDFLTAQESIFNQIVLEYGLPVIPSRPQTVIKVAQSGLRAARALEDGRVITYNSENSLKTIELNTLNRTFPKRSRR